MTEPQVWVLIGVFAAAMFGMIGIVTTNFNRTVTTAIGGLRDTMDARFETIDARFEALDAKFSGQLEVLDSKFTGQLEVLDSKFSGKFDVLDRDIQALSRHVFGADPR